MTKSRTSPTSVTNIELDYYFQNQSEVSLSGASSPSIETHPKIKNPKIISQKVIFYNSKVFEFTKLMKNGNRQYLFICLLDDQSITRKHDAFAYFQMVR